MRKAFRGDIGVRPDPMWDRRYNSSTDVTPPPLGETLGGRKQQQSQQLGRGQGAVSSPGSGSTGEGVPGSLVGGGAAGVEPSATEAPTIGQRLRRRSPPPPPYAPLHPEQQPTQQEPGGGQQRRSFGTVSRYLHRVAGPLAGSTGRVLASSKIGCGSGMRGGSRWLIGSSLSVWGAGVR